MATKLPKIPKIQYTAKGRRFIVIQKKKVFLADNISERQLIKFIIARLTKSKVKLKATPTKRAPKVKDEYEPVTHPAPSNYPPVYTDPKSASSVEANVTEEVLKKIVKEQLQDKIELQASINNHKEIGIKQMRRDYTMSHGKDELLQLAKAKNVPLVIHPSKITKEEIVRALEDHKAVNFEKLWILKYHTPIRIKSQPIAPVSTTATAIATTTGTKPAGKLKQPVQTGKGEDPLISEEGLSTTQIDSLMKRYPHFLGTIASNQLYDLIPLIKPRTEFGFVMNLDKSNQPGSHWVSMYCDGKTSMEYFNSFADPPSNQFMRDLRTIAEQVNSDQYLDLKQNHVIEQSNNSTNCGFFAMKFLIDRFHGKPFQDCTTYDEHLRGEKDIREWIKTLDVPSTNEGQDGEGLKEIYEGIKKGLAKGVQFVKNHRVATLFKDVATSGSHRMNFSPSVRALLAKYGNEKITQIKVCRKPIQGMIHKVLNWVSQGVFEQNLKDAGYDKAMHLYMLIKLQSGAIIKAEKNHVIEMFKTSDWSSDETIDSSTPSTTLNDFFNKARTRVGDAVFFVYDSKTQNCQYFLRNCLQANSVWTESLSKFVMQDSESIYKNLGLLEKVNKAFTDIAGKADHAIFGAGEKKKPKLTLRKS